MSQAAKLRKDLPPEIPDDVHDPRVPKARGVVRLPQRVNWSEADPIYDLDDRRQRALAYEQVLAEGTAEDVRRFIDVDELIEVWDELVLPRAVSRAWIDWVAEHRGVRLRDWRDKSSRPTNAFIDAIVALTLLQERIAALVAGLPEARGFALAGGAGLAAHGLLDRPTRDLDYFASPEDPSAVHALASAVERTCAEHDLAVRRERQAEAFVRLSVSDGSDDCEVDIAIDYRALDPVQTRIGPTLDLRELGAN